MNDAQRQPSTAKALVLVILVATATAVIVTLIQTLILGKSNVAVTGGVVGAITAVLALRTMRKKTD